MKTIGLIDNYMIMRKGLAITLTDHFKDVQVLESDSIAAFCQLYKKQNPDLVILGNNFSSKQICLDMARELKSNFPTIPLIVYDDLAKHNLTAAYFKLGINGYLLKQNSASEMIYCVNTVLSGKHYLCPVLLEMLLKSLYEKEDNHPKHERLTARESEIANYLTQGMKTSWIAKTLGRKPSTISTIKFNIFKKMKVENIIELRKAISLDVA